MRSRLRARIVERRAAEVVNALAWRHGNQWPALALRGDFHSNEALHRQCEAFGLRPELERRVLQAVCARARAWPAAGDKRELAMVIAISDPQSPQVSPTSCQPRPLLMSRPELAAEMDPLAPESDGSLAASLPGSSLASPAGPSPAPSPATSPQLVARLPGESASAATALLLGEAVAGPGHPATDSTRDSEAEDSQVSDCLLPASPAAAPLWRAPWRMRVMRTLGLQAQRWWSRGSSSESEPALRPAQKAEGDEDEDEDEERLLSSKLVAALENAEMHAASARAARGGCSALLAAEKSFAASWPTDAATSRVQSQRRSAAEEAEPGRRKTWFSETSEVCFFHTDVSSDHRSTYERELRTKGFDGPSGHKAKRRGELRLWNPAEGEEEDDEDEEEEETFEEACDEIAELMGRQRHLLLWAASWS